MTEMELLIDLHRQQARQGPGSDAQTRLMMSLAGLENTAGLQIADIGCGTGASSVLLATELGAEVTAVDFLPEFLAELTTRAAQAGVANHIQTMACDMTELPFADSAFDVLWAEGAIYNIGFEKGVQQWRRFLKPDGVLVASEITWTTAARPDDIEAYWQANYPEIDTASVKIKQLEAAVSTAGLYGTAYGMLAGALLSAFGGLFPGLHSAPWQLQPSQGFGGCRARGNSDVYGQSSLLQLRCIYRAEAG